MYGQLSCWVDRERKKEKQIKREKEMYCGFYTDSSEIYGVVERESDRDECKREREKERKSKRTERVTTNV